MADASEVPDYLTKLESRVVHLRDAEGMKWAEIGRELGMDRRNAQKAHQRAHAKMAQHGDSTPFLEQRPQTVPLSAKIEKAAWQALWRMLSDPAPLDRRSLKELVLIWKQMIDRRQLLPGKPMQMIKIYDIRKLDEEFVLLIKEMEQRGGLIDLTLEEPIADVPVESADAGGGNGTG